MRLACRHGSLHNAVRLAGRPQPHRYPRQTRSISSVPAGDGPAIYGSFTPKPQANPHAREIAVLGGGITGLTTAFNLTRDVPHAKITLLELQNRLGGWVESELFDVDDGKVLFEWGPRTLRPDLLGAGRATLQLIDFLRSLDSSIRGATHTHPAAVNRYIYYPDRLVRIPQPIPGDGVVLSVFKMLYAMFTEPAFKGWRGAFGEPRVPPRHSGVEDESVGDFVKRRFGRDIADNLLSALFHGIYAGDIYKLSARTLLSQLWYLETRDNDGNGVLAEMAELYFKGHLMKSHNIVKFHNRYHGERPQGSGAEHGHYLETQMRMTSVYTLVRGIGELTNALSQELEKNPNVTLLKGAKVDSLEYSNADRKFTISHTSSDQQSGRISADYVVNTLSPKILADLVAPAEASATSEPASAKPSLAATLRKCCPPAVSVMVVNLYYQNPDLLSVDGFGYLIPRSVPVEQNPERALGVIFGSQTAGPRGAEAQREERDLESGDNLRQISRQTSADIERLRTQMAADPQQIAAEIQSLEQFLKELESKVKEIEARGKQTVTIQMGQDTASGTKLTVMLGGHWWSDWTESDLPSETEAIEMAKSVLARHLKISEQPLLAKARLQRDCIPQYQVGYHRDMARINTGLMQQFDGKLKVAGSWWQGAVGINDCIKTAREVSTAIREDWDSVTGIDEFGKPSKWVLIDRRTGKYHMDPLGTL